MDSLEQRRYTTEDGKSAKVRIRQFPPSDYREDVEERIRLHLGSGTQNWTGWIDIDGFSGGGTNKPDITHDIKTLPMYEDNSVDEIMLIHVFEHLYLWEAMKALKEWYRVLKVGGKLTIEVPCLDYILGHFNNRAKDPYLTMFGLYGEQAAEEEEMTHRWCYSKSQLTNDLKVAGFSDVKLKNAVYHRIERDIRVEGVK